MTVLNTADAVYLGDQKVDAVYAGANKVWPSKPLPLTIPNCQMWLDATTVAPGYVASWVDRSPSALVASVGSGYQPTRNTTPDGQAAVQFGYSDNYLDIDGLGTLLQGLSVYTAIARVWPTSDLSGYPIILTSPVTASWQWLMEIDSTAGFYWGVTTSQYRYYPPGPATGQWWILSFVMNPSDPHAFINGTEEVQTRYGPNGDLTDIVPYLGPTVRMGAYWDGNYGMNGWISDVLFYDRNLTPTERQSIESYLATRPS